jgi:hypothetical protein
MMINENVALLDTYFRKRAVDNLAKGPPPERDVISHDPTQRVEMRFTDVQTQPQPIQPRPQAAQQSVQPQPVQTRGIPPAKAKTKVPRKGTSGEQEIGVV